MSISISIFSALELAGYPGRALAAPSASTLFTPTDDAHYGSTKVFDGRIGDPGRDGHCAHGVLEEEIRNGRGCRPFADVLDWGSHQLCRLFGVFDQAGKNADHLTAVVHDRRAAVAIGPLALDQQVAVDLGGRWNAVGDVGLSVTVDLSRSPSTG